jgi:glycerol uptake facilitator-like aquaporin
MGFLLELILYILFEILGQAIGAVILYIFFEPLKKQPHPWLAAIGYAMIGATIGGLSLFFLPNQLMKPMWRNINLLLTPIITGVVLAFWQSPKTLPKTVIYQNPNFYYGFIFALSWLLIRFIFAKSIA